MPWQKGQSGNPLGSKTKKQWIKEQTRFEEAKKTYQKLLEARDGMVLERKQVGENRDGTPIMADVVASMKDFVDVCKEIMNRSIGRPAQEIVISKEDGKPFAWNLVLQQPGEQPKQIELKPEEATYYFPDGDDGEAKH